MRHLLLLLLSVIGLAAAETKRCVFCEIVAGQREQAAVYRDDKVMAFMTIGPVNPGHVLVIPLVHADNYLEVQPEALGAMLAAAQRIGRALQLTDLNAEGIQLLMNTGRAAGQTVFHAHLHVIPRHTGDSGIEQKSEAPRPTMAELEAVAAKIRVKL
ncbi:MAG: HIT family protein [Opitutae bacterium]|nr:HIT family protein [Opitutae bacterium]